MKEIVAYLKHWKSTVQKRDGFNDEEKESMVLSRTTENGMKITSKNCSCITAYIVKYFIRYSIIISGANSKDFCYRRGT